MSENINFVQKIVKWLEDNQIFLYDRKTNEQRALGMLLIVAHFSQCFSINRDSLQLSLFPFWDFASLSSLLLSNLPLRSPKTY